MLRSREEHLQSIFEEATKKTKDLKNDKDKYTKVLEDLILEVRSVKSATGSDASANVHYISRYCSC